MFLSIVRQRINSLGCRYCRPVHSVASLLTLSIFISPSCVSRCYSFMCGNTASSMANPVVVPARETHTASIIFLHGLGDTGTGWAAGFDDILRKSRLDHIKVVCPTAQSIPVTLNMRMQMPAWFDIASLNFDGDQDEEGIKASSKILNDFIDEEVRLGIPGSRILIGGFSQGGAIALYTALTTERELGGVIALSTWLPLHKTFPQAFVGTKRDYPVMQCHGDVDPVVNLRFGIMTQGLLKKYCKDSQFTQYKGLPHSSSDQEMSDVKEFISKMLPNMSSKN